ncbi:FAD-binding domain-containing protein [Lacinutrix cladophorae]
MASVKQQNILFPISYTEILERIRTIDPIKYTTTRNYTNGAVSYLSPYISRGVISTKLILSEILQRGYPPIQIEKFIQELAWRDYWQQVWIAKGDSINENMKQKQTPVLNKGIPTAILNANTGIEAIDKAITNFYATGYIHNHVRMYIAALTCNIAQSYWKLPAQWMYYHLLDADWASNALSWQWVAGTNANKKYVANQDNINKFCFTDQKNTYLDVSYTHLPLSTIPSKLQDISSLSLKTILPKQKGITINKNLPTCIYNFYNLDPNWKKEITANRVLLLEPSHFEKYPIAQKTLDFILAISKENITDIQIYIGEFDAFTTKHPSTNIYFKEHPLQTHYKGTEAPRDWMFTVGGYYPSFFSFWKKCKKQLDY